MKVETQGSVGAKDVLTAEDIAAADAVVIAADTKVDLSRFVGKRIYQTGTKEALKHGDDVIGKALASNEIAVGGRGWLRRRRRAGRRRVRPRPPPAADGAASSRASTRT